MTISPKLSATVATLSIGLLAGGAVVSPAGASPLAARHPAATDAAAHPAGSAATASSSTLREVSEAPHTADAFALGDQIVGSTLSYYVVDRYGSTAWKKLATLPSNDGPAGIGAGSAHSIWLAGTNGSAEKGIVLHSTGGAFHAVKLPKLGTSSSLSSITADSSKDAWAVGSASTSTSTRPVLLHSKGTKWSKVSLPASLGAATFNLVSASSPHNVWIMGTTSTGRALFHDNGHKITSTKLPGSSQMAQFEDVAAAGSKNAYVVGYVGTSTSSGYHQSGYSMRWNGHKWSVLKTPNPKKFTLLTAVAASGSTVFAVGVGQANETVQKSSAVILKQSGKTWKVEHARDRGQNTELASVSVGSSHSAVAVGTWYPGDICGGPAGRAFTETFSGHSWSAPSVPQARPAC